MCLSHDPARRGELVERARRGGTAKADHRAAHTVDWRTVAGVRATLEAMATEVWRSGGDTVARAGALSKLISQALDLLKAEEIVRENLEMRQFIQQHWPEAKGVLRAVR